VVDDVSIDHEADVRAMFPETTAKETSIEIVVDDLSIDNVADVNAMFPEMTANEAGVDTVVDDVSVENEADVSAMPPDMTANEAGVDTAASDVPIENETIQHAMFPDMKANEAGVYTAAHDILMTDMDCIGTDRATDNNDIAAIPIVAPIADINMNETSSAVCPSTLKFPAPLSMQCYVLVSPILPRQRQLKPKVGFTKAS
jgi:hypothetical protein